MEARKNGGWRKGGGDREDTEGREGDGKMKKEVKGRAERARKGGRLKLSYRPTDKHTRATQWR